MRILAAAVLSLSGRFALQGEQARRGLLLWAEAGRTAAGGLAPERASLGPVELVVLDDESRQMTLLERLGRLLEQRRPDLLFGPYSSVLTRAAARLAERHRIVLWNHGGSTDALAADGCRYLVDLLTPASQYFPPVLDAALASAPDLGRLALLRGARGTFAPSVADGARRHAAQRGLELVLDAEYPLEPDGWPGLVERVLATEAEVVLGVGATEADLAFARALAASGWRPRLLGLVAAPLTQFGEVLGPAAEAIVGPSQWEAVATEPPVLGPTGAEFSAAYTARFGAPPDYPAVQAYAAGLIAGRCLGLVGQADQEWLLATARALDATTLYGRFKLDGGSWRQVGHEMVVIQWQDGRKRVVWPPRVAEAELRLG